MLPNGQNCALERNSMHVFGDDLINSPENQMQNPRIANLVGKQRKVTKSKQTLIKQRYFLA